MPAPQHANPIPFVTLTDWVKAAARCGFSIEPVFKSVGITADLVHRETASVDPDVFRILIAECIARSRNGHFPFVLGETFAFDYLPDLETFLTTSPTLRDSLKVLDWVRELINPYIDFTLVEHGPEASLRLRVPEAGADAAVLMFLSESTFAAVRKFGRSLLGWDEPFLRLSFRHAAPPHAVEYTKFFGVPVDFGQAEYALIIDRANLDRPLGGAFPALHHQAGYLVEQRLQDRPKKKDGFVVEIERAMAVRPSLLGQGIERVAEVLQLHPRTLQRRLADEGEDWTSVQDRVRFRLAADWLEAGSDDLESIGERLGFSDRRSFTRAFTRWSGVTPSAFRAKARAQ